MGKQLPDVETTRLLISESEDDEASIKSSRYESLLEYSDSIHSSERSQESLLARGWTHYNLHLERHPIVVKGVTAFFLLGLGDALAQLGQHWALASTTSSHSVRWDFLRSLRFGAFGLVGAFWSHHYFDRLDSTLPPTPRPCSCTTFFKVFVDQFIVSPLVLFIMILGLDVMKGAGVELLWHDMRLHYLDALVANWKVWLPASFFNLAFVDPKHRVLFVNLIFFLWIIILSVMLNP